jgi:hypothetical protein
MWTRRWGSSQPAAEEYAELLALDADDRAAAIGWIESDTFRADLLRSRRRKFEDAQALLEPAVARARTLLAAHPDDPAVIDAAAAAIQALGRPALPARRRRRRPQRTRRVVAASPGPGGIRPRCPRSGARSGATAARLVAGPHGAAGGAR